MCTPSRHLFLANLFTTSALIIGGSPARSMRAAAAAPACSAAALYESKERDAAYKDNTAQYLIDLHDSKATFDFCGGMMFQLVLTEKLRSELVKVAAGGGEQPTLFDASHRRMSSTPGYSQSAAADERKYFHGREVRSVPDAAGGMNFVLQLSHSKDDPEGWTAEEVVEYNGWAPDSRRKWRTGEMYEAEGVKGFRAAFGPKAFGLHHRFYLHRDGADNFWLSAEDGCEGRAAQAGKSLAERAFDALRGR